MDRHAARPDRRPSHGAPGPNSPGIACDETLPRTTTALWSLDADGSHLPISWERREQPSDAFLRLYARIFADLAREDLPNANGTPMPMEDEAP